MRSAVFSEWVTCWCKSLFSASVEASVVVAAIFLILVLVIFISGLFPVCSQKCVNSSADLALREWVSLIGDGQKTDQEEGKWYRRVLDKSPSFCSMIWTWRLGLARQSLFCVGGCKLFLFQNSDQFQLPGSPPTRWFRMGQDAVHSEIQGWLSISL